MSAPGRIRTLGQELRRLLLCPLSYGGGVGAAAPTYDVRRTTYNVLRTTYNDGGVRSTEHRVRDHGSLCTPYSLLGTRERMTGIEPA